MARMTYSHPVDPATYDSSDGFGSMKGRKRPHKGGDYMVDEGTTVCSPSDGTVVVAQWSDELGNVIGIEFDDGMVGGLAHNSAFIRSVGDRVKRLEPVSLSGDTGSASTGPHLHMSLGSTFGAIFGEGYGDTLVDPFKYIQEHLGGGSTATRKRERDMLLFHTEDAKAPNGTIYHIITADGREAQFTSGDSTFPGYIAGQLGNSAPTDRSLLDSLKAQLRASAPPAPAPLIDFAPLIKAISAAATRIITAVKARK